MPELMNLGDFDRNKTGSRITIVANLQNAGGWITCKQALGPFRPEGPRSEDLQDLVTEGAVKSNVSIGRMSPGTLVRIALL